MADDSGSDEDILSFSRKPSNKPLETSNSHKPSSSTQPKPSAGPPVQKSEGPPKQVRSDVAHAHVNRENNNGVARSEMAKPGENVRKPSSVPGTAPRSDRPGVPAPKREVPGGGISGHGSSAAVQKVKKEEIPGKDSGKGSGGSDAAKVISKEVKPGLLKAKAEPLSSGAKPAKPAPSSSKPAAVDGVKKAQPSQKPQPQPRPAVAKPAPKVKEDFDSDEQDDDDDDDDKPIVMQKKPKAPPPSKPAAVVVKKRPAEGKIEAEPKKKMRPPADTDDSEDDDKPLAAVVKPPPKAKQTAGNAKVPAKKAKEAVKGKRKREEKDGKKKKDTGGDDKKWKTLEHNGVIFPPLYTPHGVKMLYDGKPVTLTPAQEEVATMFAVMKDTDYAQKPKFCQNFWSDWKKILGAGHVIKDLNKCDFTPIYDWHMVEKEKKKNMSSEEKKRIKEEKALAEDKYMWAIVDDVKEKVGNFRVEPPGLFRGRGEHPKMGKLKRRIQPEDVVINIGKEAPVPVCPVPGHKWKEVKHDRTVTWLAYWKDPISTSDFKYVFLSPSSGLKGESDREKYEKARKLKHYIDKIRENYQRDFDSKDTLKRQVAVATYLIDRLALRAGNEKGEDEADTVGCCSLKIENVMLHPPSSIEFDFLGKDSIRYNNTVEVEQKVYKAVHDFQARKKPGDNLFDQLDTSKLNKVLQDLMPGLTAKVFRTYNASITLDRLLQTTLGSIVVEKQACYNEANKEVAILCNHQKSVSKNHSAQIEKLTEKMNVLKEELDELESEYDRVTGKGGSKAKKSQSQGTPSKKSSNPDALLKKIREKKLAIKKKELEMNNKENLKTVALGTSKINYMDPRITVAWCKKHEVPIEKIFNKSLLAKFAWAMDVDPDYRF